MAAAWRRQSPRLTFPSSARRRARVQQPKRRYQDDDDDEDDEEDKDTQLEMPTSTQTTTEHLLDSLQARLERLQLLLHGDPDFLPSSAAAAASEDFCGAKEQHTATATAAAATPADADVESVLARVRHIQSTLSRLVAASSSAQTVLAARTPFSPRPFPRSSFTSHLTPTETRSDVLAQTVENRNAPADPPTLAALVLSHAPSLHAAHSRATALADEPLPPVPPLASLASLRSRIDAAAARQEGIDAQVAVLRRESVEVVGRWYEIGVGGLDACVAEWEGRLLDAERRIRRRWVVPGEAQTTAAG